MFLQTHRSIRIYMWLFLLALIFSFAPSQHGIAQMAQVRAVLFYSPSCSHCQTVINEHLPPLFEKYGEQLVIIGINVTTPEGQALYKAAVQTFNIPEERVGVPCLIVGETVLVGVFEIPDQLPAIIENGLAAGGIAWPAIPGLEQALVEEESAAESATAEPAEASPLEPAKAGPGEASGSVAINPEIHSTQLTWQQRFAQDPAGNTLAIFVLAGLLMALLVGSLRFFRSTPARPDKASWVIAVLSIIGLGVALYLSYVEVTSSEAVCGPVGDCNTVQQSPYAILFGVLPVGVLGATGYIAILVAWLVWQYGAKKLRRVATLVLATMAAFGLLFSFYLTVLEPFVIGASCAWCLTSAVIMALIFVLVSAPAGRAWARA